MNDFGEICNRNNPIEKVFIDNLKWSAISNYYKQQLCLPFFEKEIHSILESFAINKSPGPNGFTMKFLHHNWKTLKSNIMTIFSNFYHKRIIDKVVNKTYIALIAKKDKCCKIGDYRPISLTIALYKLMAKPMADRLEEIFPHIISDYQMTFIKGRQTTEAILIANEAIDY